jgi:hypothetical protein
MAYFSQEMKAKVVSKLKEEFPNYKFGIKVLHHSQISVSVLRADYDYITNIVSELEKQYSKRNNVEKIKEQQVFEFTRMDLESVFAGNSELKDKLQKIRDIVNLVGEKEANFDDSDSMTDYFHVGFYTTISIGKDYPYVPFDYQPVKLIKKVKLKL